MSRSEAERHCENAEGNYDRATSLAAVSDKQRLFYLQVAQTQMLFGIFELLKGDDDG